MLQSNAVSESRATSSSVLLQYCDLLGDEKDTCSLTLFAMLANTCQKVQNGKHSVHGPARQAWREKATIYRQHALACLQRLGRTIPSNCGICHQPLQADKPTDWNDPHAAIVVNPCGHMQHILCQMAWNASRPGTVLGPSYVCAHCPAS